MRDIASMVAAQSICIHATVELEFASSEGSYYVFLSSINFAKRNEALGVFR